MKDNTQKVFWLKTASMAYKQGVGYYDVWQSGYFYNPTYGYVVVATDAALPLRYDTTDGVFWPAQGVMTATGRNGTKARLQVLSSTQYTITIDTDGNGTYDYSAGTFLWPASSC
ncbi:MAG: hypothetical protein HY886_02320 [Deltaproteobacteria bacterium]|nr:hypothetical protein [Deltaproteobacteria bacterium]